MKKNLTKIFTSLAVATILVVGVSYVSAYSPSTTVPNIFKTDATQQTKIGGLLSEKFLASDLGFFTKTLFPGKDSWLNIGGDLPTFNPNNVTITSAGGTIPLAVHINGRDTKNRDTVNGVDATQFIVNGQCGPVGIVNDRAPSFDFISTTNDGGYADLIAGQLSLTGGAPSNNSVLAAVDSNGNAVWAKLVIQNGQVVVVENETGSPVSTDASCATPTNTYVWSTIWAGCKYFDDSNSSTSGQYIEDPSNVCKDQNGNTVANSLCSQPAPGPRIAANSLPVCGNLGNVCYFYRKANCPSGLNIPSNCSVLGEMITSCTDGDSQESANLMCSGSVNGWGAGSSCDVTPYTAYICHTAGTDQWVTAASRGYNVTCTSSYYPQLGTGQYFSEGDIVCTSSAPSNTTCKQNGPAMSTCRPGDSVCPN